jgi:hypothetical protein
MRKCVACLMMLVLAVAAQCTAGEEQTEFQKFLHVYAHGRWAVGNWLIEGGENVLRVRSQGSIRAMAFGPGRAELAYCSADEFGRSHLWVVPIDLSPEAIERREIDARSRLLWTAPEGVSLEGPVRWPPHGAKVLARAVTGDHSDLVCVDYVSGQAEMLTGGANVLDAVWDPRGRQVAYVTASDGRRAVWVQSVPPGEAELIGRGGFDLRWSLDGDVTWLRPDSDRSWTELLWQPGMAEPEQMGQRPPRQADAQWSPDGSLCAVLEPIGEEDERQLVLYPARSASGEIIPTPEAHPKQLLGWSPDSNLVLLLAGDNHLLIASAHSAAPQLIRVMKTEEAGSGWIEELTSRVSLPHTYTTGWSMIDPEAGRPAWSSDSELLAYVCVDADALRKRFPSTGWTWAPRQPSLIVASFAREYKRPSALTGNPEVEEVVGNIRNVGLAIQMYLADNGDTFPLVTDSEGLMRVLDTYVKSQTIFMRPGTEDDIVVRYVVPPGLYWGDLGGVDRMPVAIVDYHPDFFAIAYGDSVPYLGGRPGSLTGHRSDGSPRTR